MASTAGRRIRRWTILILLIDLNVRLVSGQLAITEVMSSEAGNSPVGSDFWELSNFGTNDIDLTGYYFTDDKTTPEVRLIQAGDTNSLLRAGESAVFIRTAVTTNVAQFREWWGALLPAQLQLRMYGPSPGLSSVGDKLQLYNRTRQLVDAVAFGEALPGVSFTCDSVTGEFGVRSVSGQCGAFCAAIVPPDAPAPDLGSPGFHCGSIPLGILQQPTSQEVCAGTEATFSVRAAGLPRPKYQWYFKDTPLADATTATLTITNATPDNEGKYQVELSSSLGALRSSIAVLTVNASPCAPTLLLPPADLELYAGQVARFAVTVCAFPMPNYQWFSNGIPIEGAIEHVLRMENCQTTMSGAEFCVVIENALGITNAYARLTVTPKPTLRITELFASALPDCPPAHDWFEVTNLGTKAVDLNGYRILDQFDIEHAVRLTNTGSILPGESVIFVERMTPDGFEAWWGTDNLPRGPKVIPFAGFGLKGTGGELYLWNAAAEENGDVIDSVSYAGALAGRSIYFREPGCGYGCDSETGMFGAFRSEGCGDIGSPGYTANPLPHFLDIRREGVSVLLKWRAVEARRYRIRYKADLAEATWKELGVFTATAAVQTTTDTNAGDSARRFYCLEELP